MEMTVATWAAPTLVLSTIVVRWVWSLLDSSWFKPKKLERYLREQGLEGNSYRFLYGDLKEHAALLAEASSKPMNLSHDVVPRLTPFDDRTQKTHGVQIFSFPLDSYFQMLFKKSHRQSIVEEKGRHPIHMMSPLWTLRSPIP